MRQSLAGSLIFASTTGLLGCPQLLSDDFDANLEPGADTCARQPTCAAGASGSSGASGAAGSAGATSGAGGSASNAGGSGTGGSDSAGTGGASAAWAGASGASGGGPYAVDPPPPPGCWSVGLDDPTHVAVDNCLGIHGWNNVVTDPDTNSAMSLSYADDGVCFTGTIVNEGWGAVYNLTLNDESPWDAAARGVGGFQLDATGERLPPQLRVIYSDATAGDFCRIITPAPGVAVPFDSAHPDCSQSSSSVTDASDLTFIRLVFAPTRADYDVNFCLNIRAIPCAWCRR